VQRFDPSKQARLATYASYWIRACMMDLVVRTHGPVRVGSTRAERRIFFGLGRARRHLEQCGVEVTSEALAHRLRVEVRELESMSMRLGRRDLSLDSPLYDEGPSAGAVIAADGPSPEERLAEEEEHGLRSSRLADALAALPERERAIVKARHLAESPPTLAELGRRFGVSRERVRQLEERAVELLRRHLGVEGRAPQLAAA
jgi:RNA polymerase sigma-32 factor